MRGRQGQNYIISLMPNDYPHNISKKEADCDTQIKKMHQTLSNILEQ